MNSRIYKCTFNRTSLCSSAIVALQMIMPLLASGPIWNVTSKQVLSSCQNSWWTHSLLVANIFPSQVSWQSSLLLFAGIVLLWVMMIQFLFSSPQCAPHLIIMSIFGQLLLVSLVVSLIFTRTSFIASPLIFALLAVFTRTFVNAASSLSSGVLLHVNTDER